MVREAAKAKTRGRNEHRVISTNKETSLAGMVGQITEDLKSSNEKFEL